MTFEINKLDAPLGARIDGIDLSQPLDQETAAEIRDALHEYIVLYFPEQTFSPEEQLGFARALGPVRIREMPEDYVIPDSSREVPGIAYVSNIRNEAGEPIGVIPDGEMWFHHDTCYTPAPDLYTMLYAIDVPTQGGNTMWANMRLAWETLPDELKQALEGRKSLNVYDYAVDKAPDLANLDNIEHAWNPAVAIHPATGRKAIFVNRLMSCRLEGMDDSESARVLNAVFEHFEQRQFIYEHPWKPGDFIIWDNLSCTHARTHFERSEARRLRRCKVNGAPLAA